MAGIAGWDAASRAIGSAGPSRSGNSSPTGHSAGLVGKVMVLDANERSALAAIRSLGKRGVPVVAAGESSRTLSGASRYCHATVQYPSPYGDPAGFVASVRRETVKHGIAVVFPMSDVTTQLLLEHQSLFATVCVPLPPREAFESVTDKWKLYELGRRLSIPMPITQLAESEENLAASEHRLRFPVVVKPRRSRLRSKEGWISPPVERAHSVAEINDALRRSAGQGLLVQEYIAGEGRGLFALCDRGRAVTFFAHRRLREKPPWGGVSVLSESVPVDPGLRQLVERLLDRVGWHGVAMAEFKITPEGRPYLIEINGRFWGSLQLAIDAGIDFPWLLYRLARGEHLDAIKAYMVGVRNRWLLGDVDHLYLTLRSGKSVLEKWQTIRRFLAFFQAHTRFEVNRWDDMGPFWMELRRYLARTLN